jgi:glyoxylate/hydroxypyruvate reductase A
MKKTTILLEAEGLESIWHDVLKSHHPNADIRHWPHWGDMSEGDYLIAWRLPHGTLGKATNLKALLSVGAGVDQLLEDPSFPKSVPLVRLVDPTLNIGMAEFTTMAVMSFHRNLHDYLQSQSKSEWKQIRQVLPKNRSVGVLGMGSLATSCANTLKSFGFDLATWGHEGAKPHDGIDFYEGYDELETFLKRTEILIILTPLNKSSENLLNEETLSYLPSGACILNVARAPIMDEDAVLRHLNSDQLGYVWLDVFNEEPVSKTHWAWKHPKAIVTPHIAAATLPASAAEIVATNIARFEAGKDVADIVRPSEVLS